MKKLILIPVLLIFLASCGEKDSICSCIESGNKLNTKANEILQKDGASTEKDEKQLQALKADKDKKCAEFKTMGGEEMKKRMEDCQ